MNKRILSMVLAFVLVLGTVSISVAAPFDLTHKENPEKAYTLFDLFEDFDAFDDVFNDQENYLFEAEDGKLYSVKSINEYLDENPEVDLEDALKEIEPEEIEEKELKVTNVSAIDEYGVTVKFEASTEDNDEANVVVKDGEGNVIETEARLIAEGETTATFDFVTPFEANYEFTGVWTVNGVEYSFDAINQLKDIIDSAIDGNQITFQAALDAAGITYEDELKIGDYLTAVREADLDEYTNTLADVQEIIDEIDGTAADEAADAAKVKAVEAAKTQAQLLSALQDNFDAVNPAWIVGYFNSEDVNIDDAEGIKASDIQDAIYDVNAGAIDDAKAEVETAADQAAVTALIEAWMKPDAEGETAKETAIKDSKLAEAAYKVKEATTANRLYDALVAFDNLLPEDAKIEDLDSNNKSFYFANIDASYEGGITNLPAAIVAAGNTAAEEAQTAIDGRLEVTTFSVVNREDYDSTAKGPVKVLGYWVAVNVNKDNSTTARTVGDTESIVIELYDGETLLGKQSLNATGYEKHSDKSSIGGTIDAYGEYLATSWDHEWYGELTDIPTKAVATVTYKDGAVAEAVNETAPTGTDVFKAQLVADLVEVVKESEDVAEVEETLVALANLESLDNFLATPKADRTFVAETILEEAAATKDAWTAETLNNYIGTLNTDTIEAAKTAVNKLTNASDEEAVITALEKVKVFKDLTPIAKKDVANAFIEEVLEGLEEDATPNFKSYTELSNFVEGLIK